MSLLAAREAGKCGCFLDDNLLRQILVFYEEEEEEEEEEERGGEGGGIGGEGKDKYGGFVEFGTSG